MTKQFIKGSKHRVIIDGYRYFFYLLFPSLWKPLVRAVVSRSDLNTSKTLVKSNESNGMQIKVLRGRVLEC